MPTNRATVLTPAARARKIAKAVRALETVLADLDATCEDFTAVSFALTLAEREEWAQTVRFTSAVSMALSLAPGADG